MDKRGHTEEEILEEGATELEVCRSLVLTLLDYDYSIFAFKDADEFERNFSRANGIFDNVGC